MANKNAYLSRAWPGNQISRGYAIEKIFLGNPSAFADQFIFHHRDMRGGAAERDRSQFQKNEGQLCE